MWMTKIQKTAFRDAGQPKLIKVLQVLVGIELDLLHEFEISKQISS